MTNLRLAVIQDYVPEFRVGFFSALAVQLREADIDLVVVAGEPTKEQISRRDRAGHMPWLRFARSRRLHAGSVDVPFYGTSRYWRDCDGVIFPLRGNSLDLNLELLKRRYTHRKVGVWGHVGAYVKEPNVLDRAVERLQMQNCDRVFSYTPAGALSALRAGLRPSQITTVMNSLDLSNLLTEAEMLEPGVVKKFERTQRLTSGKTFGYIGGIDEPKRIDFFVETLDVLWRRDPEIKLIVGGRGNQEYLLTESVNRGQVILLGYAKAAEKAMIYRLSRAILNPGRIGLLAIECMAMGVPILTTDWKYHAPEYEYLTEGIDVITSHGGPAEFADEVLRCAGSPMPRPKVAGSYPTLDQMVMNFTDGALKMMSR